MIVRQSAAAAMFSLLERTGQAYRPNRGFIVFAAFSALGLLAAAPATSVKLRPWPTEAQLLSALPLELRAGRQAVSAELACFVVGGQGYVDCHATAEASKRRGLARAAERLSMQFWRVGPRERRVARLDLQLDWSAPDATGARHAQARLVKTTYAPEGKGWVLKPGTEREFVIGDPEQPPPPRLIVRDASATAPPARLASRGWTPGACFWGRLPQAGRQEVTERVRRGDKDPTERIYYDAEWADALARCGGDDLSRYDIDAVTAWTRMRAAGLNLAEAGVGEDQIDAAWSRAPQRACEALVESIRGGWADRNVDSRALAVVTAPALKQVRPTDRTRVKLLLRAYFVAWGDFTDAVQRWRWT